MTEYLHVDRGSIAYELAGVGPLIVLAHGIGDDRFAYRFISPALIDAGYRVATVDLRGCGESSTDWPRWDRTAIAADLIALIRRLGGTAVVVGHSIAGGAAVIAAATEPSLIAAVVGLAPFTRKQTISARSLRVEPFRKAATHLAMVAASGSRKHWMTYIDLAYPGRRPVDWNGRRSRFQTQLADPGRREALKKMARTSAADAGAQLRHVQCPVLLIMGTADPDWANPTTEAQEILALLQPGMGRVKLIEGAGHYTHDQEPARVVTAITDFLEANDDHHVHD